MPADLLRLRRQRGQVLAYVAVVAPLLLLPLTAYLVEATRVATVQARLQAVAAAAAEDAVQQIDARAFRAGGRLQPDPAGAAAAARAELAAQEPGASLDSIEVTGPLVRLEVSERVPLVFAGLLGPRAVSLHARAVASLKAGY